jgi:WD40 repeat protein
MIGTNGVQNNPYVGPRPFREEEHHLFWGRNDEIDIVAGMVMARRVSLLFASSGAGKTSLLRAGVIYKLTYQETVGRGRWASTYQKMRVLPILTVASVVPPVVKNTIANIFIFSALYSLFPDADPEWLADQTLTQGLAAYFTPAQAGSRPEDPASNEETSDALLIFDQFEELFSHHLDHWQERAGFFRQVSQALNDFPNLHVLFSMREDFIADLTPYLSLLPDPLHSRFRLELLNYTAALKAIQQPAQSAGRTFGEGVAEVLVNNLRRIQAGRRSNPVSGEPMAQEFDLGETVEPVHLQIVCSRLWQSLPPEHTLIRPEDLTDFGDVDQALAEFYQATIDRVCGETGVPQGLIRTWFEEKLITPARTRSLVYRGEADTEGLSNPAVDILKEAYIIRPVVRGGDTWYELAHDRLVEPIKKSNAEYFEKSPTHHLQKLAELWKQQNRPDSLLLKDRDLQENQNLAKANPEEITDREREFLDRSQIVQRQTNRMRILNGSIYALAGFLLLALIVAGMLYRQSEASAAEARQQQVIAQTKEAEAKEQRATAVANEDRANQQQATAQANEAEANRQRNFASAQHLLSDIKEAAQIYSEKSDLSLLLAVESSRFEAAGDPQVQTIVNQALREMNLLVEQGQNLIGYLRWHKGPVNQVRFTPDQKFLVTAGEDGDIVTWDYQSVVPIIIGEPMKNNGAVKAIAITKDSARLASAVSNGSVILWDLKTHTRIGQPLLTSTPMTGYWASLAISSDDIWLAGGHSDGQICVWRLDQTSQPCKELGSASDMVWELKFNPTDPTQLASGSQNGEIRLWQIPGGQSTKVGDHPNGVLGLDFSPDGKTLATGGNDRTVRLWDVKKLEAIGSPLQGHLQWVIDVAFSPKGTLASASGDGSIRLWDTSKGQPLGLPIEGYQGFILNIDFSQDGSFLAAAQNDGNVRLWSVGGSANRFANFNVLYVAAAYSPNRRWLAMVDIYNRIFFYDLKNNRYSVDDFQADHPFRVESVTFSPDGKMLVTASSKNSSSTQYNLQVWDVVNLDSDRPSLIKHGAPFDYTGTMTRPAISPDHRTIAIGNIYSDKNLMLWDVVNQKSTYISWETYVEVQALTFSNDGKSLAISYSSNGLIYDLASQKTRCQLAGHDNKIWDLQFSPDNTWLATASGDTTVRLWDSGTCQELPGSPLSRHRSTIYKLAISPSGKWLGSLDQSGLLVIWDVGTKAVAAEIQTGIQVGINTQIDFSSDEHTLFTFDNNLISQGDTATAILDQWPIGMASYQDLATLQQDLCKKVRRNLTQSEWDKYFPGKPYQESCPILKIIDLYAQAGQAALRGDLPQARDLYQQAGQLDTTDWQLSNMICWTGSLDSAAHEVLPACERAVKNAPADEMVYILDSRGLARALTGDTQNAIADFEAYIASMQSNPAYADTVSERKNWIEALKAGRDPFTPEVLQALRNE